MIKPTSVVALDIGSYSVKCAEVVHAKDGLTLTAAAVEPFMNSSDEAAVSAVRTALGRTSGRGVRISVSGSPTLIRRLKLPRMTPGELKGAIRFEAESQIPFPIDDCILDFQILIDRPAEKTMEVLLVAVKKDFVINRLKLLSALEVRPEAIDADILCLVNAFEKFSSASETTYALLDIGHRHCTFAVVQGGLPFLVRDITAGAGQEVLAAVQKGYETLAEEVKYSIDYFGNQASEELKGLYLSGGGAMPAGVGDFLSAEIGLPCAVWNVSSKLAAEPAAAEAAKDHGPELNVAIGMALPK